MQADQLVVVNAENRDFLWDGDSRVAAGIEDAGSVVVRIGKDRRRLLERGKPLRELCAVQTDKDDGVGISVVDQPLKAELLHVAPFGGEPGGAMEAALLEMIGCETAHLKVVSADAWNAQ